jgi:hypothetical protein
MHYQKAQQNSQEPTKENRMFPSIAAYFNGSRQDILKRLTQEIAQGRSGTPEGTEPPTPVTPEEAEKIAYLRSATVQLEVTRVKDKVTGFDTGSGSIVDIKEVNGNTVIKVLTANHVIKDSQDIRIRGINQSDVVSTKGTELKDPEIPLTDIGLVEITLKGDPSKYPQFKALKAVAANSVQDKSNSRFAGFVPGLSTQDEVVKQEVERTLAQNNADNSVLLFPGENGESIEMVDRRVGVQNPQIIQAVKQDDDTVTYEALPEGQAPTSDQAYYLMKVDVAFVSGASGGPLVTDDQVYAVASAATNGLTAFTPEAVKARQDALQKTGRESEFFAAPLTDAIVAQIYGTGSDAT